MENTEPLPQKVVDRKIIILKARLDPTKARQISEENKISFFIKHGFLKPRRKDISLVGFSKYFEPFILIGGKYSIHYCKKQEFRIESNDQAQKIFIGGEEIKVETSNLGKLSNYISLPAEEHYQFTNETYFVLDRFMREIIPEKIHIAPFESELGNEESNNIDSRKVTVSLSEEIAFLQSRIAKRPSDADVIIKEIFEVNERMIIYNPMYELVFQNDRTAKTVTILIDGVTGKITNAKIDTTISEKLQIPEKVNREDISDIFRESSKKLFIEGSIHQNKQAKNKDQNVVKPDPNVMNTNQNIIQQEEIATTISATEPVFESEKATALAMDSLKRLGFENEIMPMKVTPDGELYSVELILRDKTAKVLVDTKSKEVKEYEIQESNL